MSEAVSEVARRVREYSKANRHKVSKEDWPPFQPKHFTGVALIHFKKGHTVREEIEVIAHSQHKGLKEPLGNVNVSPTTKNLSPLFSNISITDASPKTILIEGAPGIGKTTLCKEILFQWSNQKLLAEIKLVALVFLRDPVAQGIQSLHDFVYYYFNYTEKSNAIIEEYIKSTQGEGIAVILDGYDEVPEHIRNDSNSFFIKLIYQKCEDMLRCTVVITSRLKVSIELRDVVERRVEILGFTEENRRAYIIEAFNDCSNTESGSCDDDSTKDEDAQKLIKFLDTNPIINAYCYIPLNMTILLCLFTEDKSAELPTTQTEMNVKFICITISRFIKKKESNLYCSIANFKDIPKTYSPLFYELCQLAFKALQGGKVVFTKDEIRQDCKLLTHMENWSGLDLLKVVDFYSFRENIKSTLFNFLHLSFQETLAAYYITLLSSNLQIRLLKENFLNSMYFNSWIMYVGMTKGQSFAFTHFLSGNWLRIYTKIKQWLSINPGLSKDLIGIKTVCLYLFQCFSEAENDGLSQLVSQLLKDGEIDLSGQALSAVNMRTLGLFLGRSSTKHWRMLNLSNCYLGDTEIELLNSFCSDSKKVVCITTLNLSFNNFTKFSSERLVNLFLGWNVRKVAIYSNSMESKSADCVMINSIGYYISICSKLELSPFQFEILTTSQSVQIIYKLHYTETTAALSLRNYSSVHLFSCSLGSSYNDVAQIVFILADNSKTAYLYNCQSNFQHVVENITRINVSSFHFMQESSTMPGELETGIKHMGELAITLGEQRFPLHMYRVSETILDEIKEFSLELNSTGTFVFRDCRSEDINKISTHLASFSNWTYFF